MRHPFRLTYALTPSRRKTARITLALGGGLFMGEKERALSRAVLQVMLDDLTRIDILELEAYPDIPRILESGILYREEPPGQEDWQDIFTCLRMGVADCEDVACWLASERTVKDGIPTRAIWQDYEQPDGSTLFHIVAKQKNGVILDPSKILGMR